MATASASLDVGSLLRTWRERRRLTQLEVALDAGISARHLSFVETGRSKPGRAMLLGVTERLLIPYRERNQIPPAAGSCPAVPRRSPAGEREIEAADVLGPVRMQAPGGGEWSFFGMFASFDTPFEVTSSELALELLFPADQITQRAFEKGAS